MNNLNFKKFIEATYEKDKLEKKSIKICVKQLIQRLNRSYLAELITNSFL